MAYTYPPAAPTLSGDSMSINRFLNSPTLVARRVQDLAANRFIADVVLSGRQDVEGGAIVYDEDDPLFTARPVEAVSPGGEYPLTPIGTGEAQVVKVTKWGQDTLVTDEAIKRRRQNAVDGALTQVVNSVVKHVDSVALSLIASRVTATHAASSVWTGDTAKILRDILLAKAKIAALNKGYDPNVMIVDDLTWAYIASDATIAGARAREDVANPVYSGNFPIIGGLTILPTPNLPGGSGGWIVDSTRLGGIADENLGGGYTGGNVESKSMREDENDQWRLRGRRVCVPYVTDPGAGIRITGITA